MNGLRKIAVLICCLGISGSLHSQSLPREQVFVDPAFTYDHWTAEDGLPVNSVNQIIQSKEGYIWFGTNDGLVRFDGIRFKVYKSAEYEGLPSNRIVNLVETPDSTIWMKTDRAELVRFKNDEFRHLTEQDGLNGGRVHTLHLDDNGTLWIGASKGISTYENGRLTPFHPDIITEQVAKIYVNRKGVLWYKDDESLQLFRFDGNAKTHLATTTVDTDPSPFLTLSDGSTIFVTFGHIFKYENENVVEAVPDLPVDFQVVDFYEDSTGSVFIATLERGIFKLSGENWSHINTEYKGRKRGSFITLSDNIWAAGNQALYFNNRLVFSFNNQITHFVYDREGSFWFGSTSSGLFRLKPNLFKVYSEAEGVPNRNIYPVFEASNGSIWFGTHGYGPVQLKDNRIYSSFPFRPVPQNKYMRSVTERSNGDLIVSLLGDGLYKFYPRSRNFERWSTPVPRPSLARVMTIETLFEDSRNWLWAGSNHGLFVMKDGEWEQIPDIDSDPDYTVRYITEAADASLWMGTNGGGILHYKDGTFSSYTPQDGLLSNLIRSLYVDNTSTSPGYILWIGTENKGLNRLPVNEQGPDFSQITGYDQQNGLYDNVVHQILVDKNRRFWMSGNMGIYWVGRDQLEEYARGEIPEIYSTAYTEQDGLKNREANGGIQPAGIQSKDGRMWFPTQDGLVMVNPEDITRNELPPPVIIEEVTSENASIHKEKKGIVLQPAQRNFEIAYTGLSLMVPEKVRFRYRLKGFNENWTEAESRRTAFFTNVPAGDYQFEVLASNNEGVWSPEPASLSVTVLPYFYETGFFYLLMTLLFIAAVTGVIRFRTRQLKKREQELEQSVHERTAELEEEKKKTETQAQELLKLDQAKSQFFTNITHEFRTPLTLIISPLRKLLSRNGNTSGEETTIEIERMLRSSYRLQRLIDQILDVSKLEAGELKLNVQQIELVPFITTLMELFRPLTTEQEQRLEFSHPSGEHFIYADSDALEKILANLISNAIKFTPPGGDIRVEFSESSDGYQLEVRDSGIGIPEEKILHIFDRFYQADDSLTRVAEGSGIGLALVKQLVELHAGNISVRSEQNIGTTFVISFKKGFEHLPGIPRIQAPTSGSIRFEPEKYTGYASDGDQHLYDEERDVPTVLVVEDNADMRDFVSSVLHESFSVIQAGDGIKALELIQNHLPDLIVADIMMPNMDGMQLNKELKKDLTLESIPVIFLTAKTATESKLEGFAEGADDYLAKPFDPELLVARVQNIIRKRKRLREHYLGGRAPEEAPEAIDPFLKEVIQILEEHFADPDFGVLELTRLVHLDRTRLYRKLKELTSKSPQQYLSDFRMKKAAQMIRGREGSISEIAYASGFNSLAYFSKAFKKYYKVSPSEFSDNIPKA